MGEDRLTRSSGDRRIRYYQRRGLIIEPAKPEGSGFRTYGDDA